MCAIRRSIVCAFLLLSLTLSALVSNAEAANSKASKQSPPAQSDSVVEVPTEDFAQGVPALGSRSVEDAAEFKLKAANPNAVLEDGMLYLLPTGPTLKLGHAFGPNNRVQFGVGYWFNKDWALGVDIGYDYASRSYSLGSGTGTRRRVERYTYSIVPELLVSRTLFTAATKRLVLTAGGGPLIRKREGRGADTGYVLEIGPGIDWPLSKRLSFHFEQWVSLTVDPDESAGRQIGFQPQLSMIWWFR